MSIVELVGKRCLLKAGRHERVKEYRVLEVSPSGQWVRLKDENGTKYWLAVVEVSLVEELRDLKAERPHG